MDITREEFFLFGNNAFNFEELTSFAERNNLQPSNTDKYQNASDYYNDIRKLLLDEITKQPPKIQFSFFELREYYSYLGGNPETLYKLVLKEVDELYRKTITTKPKKPIITVINKPVTSSGTANRDSSNRSSNTLQPVNNKIPPVGTKPLPPLPAVDTNRPKPPPIGTKPLPSAGLKKPVITVKPKPSLSVVTRNPGSDGKSLLEKVKTLIALMNERSEFIMNPGNNMETSRDQLEQNIRSTQEDIDKDVLSILDGYKQLPDQIMKSISQIRDLIQDAFPRDDAFSIVVDILGMDLIRLWLEELSQRDEITPELHNVLRTINKMNMKRVKTEQKEISFNINIPIKGWNFQNHYNGSHDLIDSICSFIVQTYYEDFVSDIDYGVIFDNDSEVFIVDVRSQNLKVDLTEFEQRVRNSLMYTKILRYNMILNSNVSDAVRGKVNEKFRNDITNLIASSNLREDVFAGVMISPEGYEIYLTSADPITDKEIEYVNTLLSTKFKTTLSK